MTIDPRFLAAKLALPLIHRLDPEQAHRLAVSALSAGLVGRDSFHDPLLETSVLGLHFRNPVGLGAGFDKNAAAVMALAGLGFGFVEAGTVTPRPQAGNPRPRLFRLMEDRAVINRMGFNNDGMETVAARLAALPPKGTRPAPVGINIGINKEGANPEADYPLLLQRLGPYADYAVVNVSSPNTPGLRDLQSEERLRGILSAMMAQVPDRPPVLLKLAPDLSEAGLEAAVETAIQAGLQGVIVSNTTIERPSTLRSRYATETGGLSGAPLFDRSTGMLRRAYRVANGRIVLIGVGGIASGEQALTKIKAGASLVQFYSAFALEGVGIVPRLKRELAAALRREGFRSVQEAVGAEGRGA